MQEAGFVTKLITTRNSEGEYNVKNSVAQLKIVQNQSETLLNEFKRVETIERNLGMLETEQSDMELAKIAVLFNDKLT